MPSFPVHMPPTRVAAATAVAFQWAIMTCEMQRLLSFRLYGAPVHDDHRMPFRPSVSAINRTALARWPIHGLSTYPMRNVRTSSIMGAAARCGTWTRRGCCLGHAGRSGATVELCGR